MRSFLVIALLAAGCLDPPPDHDDPSDASATDVAHDMAPTDATDGSDGTGDASTEDTNSRDAETDATPLDCSFPDQVILWDFRTGTLENQSEDQRFTDYVLAPPSTGDAVWNAGDDSLITNDSTNFYRFPSPEDETDTSTLLTATQQAGGLTIEVVLRADPEQPGVDAPERRIVTWSDGVCRRNATLLWQSEADRLRYRFRYGTDPIQALNGAPAFVSETALSTTDFVHLAVTIDESGGTSTLFVDGVSVAAPSDATPAADFLDTWDDTYRIVIGDEAPSSSECTMESRSLSAEWKLVAFHAGAMSEADVQRLAGCRDIDP